ncbi:MAG: FecR family protein [Cytophagales bacterium]|nr:FecR family protein [Cytophagales bacterium]
MPQISLICTLALTSCYNSGARYFPSELKKIYQIKRVFLNFIVIIEKNAVIVEEFDNILGKILSGDATEEEKIRMMDFLDSGTKEAESYKKYYQQVLHINLLDNYNNSKRLFSRIQKDVHQVNDDEDVIQMSRQIKLYKYLSSIAAAILILILFFFVINFELQESNHSESNYKEEFVKKSTTLGQKSKIFLPDGSLVWLNSGSSIRYQITPADSSREIYLKGEAYFEVKSDRNRPFKVHTVLLTVTALGTAFNVQAYDKNESTQATLVEGKISIEGDEYYDELEPGEQISALLLKEPSGKIQFRKSNSDVNKVVAWKDGIIVMESVELNKAFDILHRWYGVKFNIEGNVDLKVPYSGKFENETLDIVLQSMSYSCSFNYTINNKIVDIKFK